MSYIQHQCPFAPAHSLVVEMGVGLVPGRNFLKPKSQHFSSLGYTSIELPQNAGQIFSMGFKAFKNGP